MLPESSSGSSGNKEQRPLHLGSSLVESSGTKHPQIYEVIRFCQSGGERVAPFDLIGVRASDTFELQPDLPGPQLPMQNLPTAKILHPTSFTQNLISNGKTWILKPSRELKLD